MTINEIFDKTLQSKAQLDEYKTVTDSVIANAVLVQKVATNALEYANTADILNKTTIGNKAEEIALMAHKTELLMLMAHCMAAIEVTDAEINQKRKLSKRKI